MRNGHYHHLLLSQNLYEVIHRTTELPKAYFQDHNRCFTICPQFSLISHHFLPSTLCFPLFPNMQSIVTSS